MTEADLTERLGEWVARGFLSLEQAKAIAGFEKGRPPGSNGACGSAEAITAETASAMAGASEEASSTEAPSARRVPLAVEIIGYMGGVIVLGALIGLVTPYWERIGSGPLALIAGIVTAALTAAGWVFSNNPAPQPRRLGNFLMFVGVAVSGVFFALVTDLVLYDPSRGQAALLITGGMFVLAMIAWLAHKTGLQLVALVLSLAGVIGSLCDIGLGDSQWLISGLSYVLMGGLLIFAAERERLAPKAVVWDLGALAVVVGMQIVTLDDWRHNGWILFLSCVLSGGLLVLGLWRRVSAGLALGAVGLVVFIPQTLYWVFGDSIGLTTTLLIAGMLLVGLALFSIVIRPRLQARKTGQTPPQ